MEIGALWPSKTIVFHSGVCKYQYIHLSPKGSQNVTKIPLKMEPESIQYGFRNIWETIRKHIPKQCQKGEEMGVQREAKSEPKSLKKGPQNTFSLLWVPLGAQGVPGITFKWILVPFLIDCRRVFDGCGRLSFVYPGYLFLSCAITLYDTFRSPLSLGSSYVA